MEKNEKVALRRFEENGKFGFKNEKGEVVIPCQWLGAEDFEDGIANVMDDNKKWGIINEKGETIIPFLYAKPLYSSFYKSLLFIEKGQKVYKNCHGDIIPPHLWKTMNTFSEGLVTIVTEDDHYGFADEEGNMVFPPIWDFAYPFEDGYAWVRDSVARYYINHKGKKYLLQPINPIDPFKDQQSGKWGFKNKEGEVIVSPQWWLVCHRFDDGMCAVINDDKKIGFVDETGQLVIPCQYVSHSYFSEELVKVQDAETLKIGYINKKGETVIPFKYLRGGDFENGMAFVMGTNEKWGAINKKDETVIPFKFGYIIGFNEGLSAFIGDNHLYGFIDESGNQVVPPIWKFAHSFENGLACVEDSNKKQGYIDKQGNLVIPCQWAVAESFYRSPSFAYVSDEYGNRFKINRQGNVF